MARKDNHDSTGAPSIRPSEVESGERTQSLEFLDVYESYFDFAWRSLALMGVRAEDLEDAAQDVMMAVHRRLAEFEGRSSLRTWIFGIAYHVASNYRRRHRRKGGHEELPASLPAPEADPLRTAMDREDLRFVQRFMQQLDDLSRTVFFAYFVERMSAKELAVALALDPDAVYVRVRTLRRRFHVALQKRGQVVS